MIVALVYSGEFKRMELGAIIEAGEPHLQFDYEFPFQTSYTFVKPCMTPRGEPIRYVCFRLGIEWTLVKG